MRDRKQNRLCALILSSPTFSFEEGSYIRKVKKTLNKEGDLLSLSPPLRHWKVSQVTGFPRASWGIATSEQAWQSRVVRLKVALSWGFSWSCLSYPFRVSVALRAKRTMVESFLQLVSEMTLQQMPGGHYTRGARRNQVSKEGNGQSSPRALSRSKNA